MSEYREFHYRLPHRIGGWRPGSHRGVSLGGAQEFVSHMRLYDRADPRRLDLRASLRNIQQEWLVRVHRQRSSIPVHAVVDVSTSMSFGSPRSKLEVAADFLQALGQSAFRAGDALGMLTFDVRERMDLFVPARLSRGMGDIMAGMLRDCSRAQRDPGEYRPQGNAGANGRRGAGAGLNGRGAAGLAGYTRDRTGAGRNRQERVGFGHWRDRGSPGQKEGPSADSGMRALESAIQHLAGKRGLVFLVSDFHWPLAGLGALLDSLTHSFVVPLVLWHPAEVEPPALNGLMLLRDMESGAQRTVWMRPRMRANWRESVKARRNELSQLFAEHAAVPFYVTGSFDSDALSRYFFELAP